MKKNKISSYLVFISIFTVVTILVLVVQKSYNNLIEPTKKVQVSDISKGINPELDISIIQEIKNRQHINPLEVPENETALSVNIITPTLTPIIASPSGQSIAPVPTLIP